MLSKNKYCSRGSGWETLSSDDDNVSFEKN